MDTLLLYTRILGCACPQFLINSFYINSLFILYSFSIRSIFVLYSFYIRSIFVPYSFSIRSIFVLYSFSIRSLFVAYFYDIVSHSFPVFSRIKHSRRSNVTSTNGNHILCTVNATCLQDLIVYL